MSIQQIPSFFRDTPNLSFPDKVMDVADEIGERTVVSCLNIKYNSWKIFLDLSALKRILVFDSTLGLDSVALAPHAESVTTVVYDAATLLMLEARLRDENIDNVDVIECSTANLPFDNNTFDLIICRDIQVVLSVLQSEITVADVCDDWNRILNVNGTLLLGINKRPILGMFSPLVQGTEQRKYLTALSLLIHLKRKKYEILDIVYCLPEQYHFDELISQSFKQSWFRNTVFIKSKIKNFLIKFTYPVGSPNANYVFVKNRADKKVPFYKHVIFKVSECVGSHLKLRRILVGNPNTVLLLLDGSFSNYVVRLPLCQNSSERIKNQYDVLSVLHTREELKTFNFPKVYAPFDVDKQNVYIEEMLSGEVLDESHLLSTTSEMVAIDWLIGFHSATISRQKMDAVDIENMVIAPFLILKKYAKSSIELRILDKLSRQAEYFFSQQDNSFFVCMHGDYKIENMLFASNHLSVTGIFDWDLAQLSGFPLIDLLYFLAYCDKLKGDNSSIPEIIFNKFICMLMTEQDQLQIDKYMTFFNMDASDLKFYGLIACVYHVVYRIDDNDKYWVQTYEDNIGKLLKPMDELF